MTLATLIVILHLSLLVAPLAAEAQGFTAARIGMLSLASPESMRPLLGAFREGMRELGYAEGQNLTIEVRYAAGRAERLPALAAELVGLNVAVIVAGSSQAVSAAQRTTTVVPIVAAGGDLLGIGAVKSLARPGGNITGLSNLTTDFIPKLPELLLTAVPKLSRVAVLWNPSHTNPTVLSKLQAATQQVGSNAIVMEARTPLEIDSVFAHAAGQHVEAVIVPPDGFYLQQANQIGGLTTKHRLPCISPYREITESGGLMSYGRNVAKSFRRAATYVDKILKGARPGELAIEQPTTLELIVNLKTAKALGLSLSPAVLARADEVVQ
jgi:putative tryptophan/tyrosine transport system substrate-binding protein